MSYSRKYCPPELANVKDVTGMGKYNRDYDVLYPIAAELAPNKTWAEFGVGCGHNTTKMLRRLLAEDGTLHLFDSWEGIPEPWEMGEGHTVRAGTWKYPSSVGISLKEIDNRLVITDGLFEKTLPYHFPEQLGLVHIDCDLYSSTRDILFGAKDHIGSGTVLIFDELIGYQYYEDHEYKALMEWLEQTSNKIEWHAKERFAAVGVIL